MHDTCLAVLFDVAVREGPADIVLAVSVHTAASADILLPSKVRLGSVCWAVFLVNLRCLTEWGLSLCRFSEEVNYRSMNWSKSLDHHLLLHQGFRVQWLVLYVLLEVRMARPRILED